MPHLLLPNSAFVHIPKTGGTWVRKALAAAEIPFQKVDLLPHAPFSELEPQVGGRFAFAFVRHPVAWYRSYWSMRMRYPRKIPPVAAAEVDAFMSDDFDAFVSSCCLQRPGAATEMFARYTGWPVKLDWVGHAERLVEGLVEALTLAGERFDPEAIRSCPPSNVAPSESTDRAVYGEATPALVVQAEHEILSRYGYATTGTPVPLGV